MDVQEIVGQLLKAAADDPKSLKQFGVDPAQAIKGATGLELTDAEVADVVKAVEPLLEGKELNMEAVMKVAGDFLSANPGELLGKVGDLFGGGEDASEEAEKEADKPKDRENPLEALEGIAEGVLEGLLKGK